MGGMSATDAPRELAEHEDSLSILDLVVVLVKHWRLIVGGTVVGGLMITGYALLTMYLPGSSPFNLLPTIYRPEAKVLLLDRNSSGLSRLNLVFAEAQDSIRQMVTRNPVVGQVGSAATVAQELLSGRTIHDQIIDEFHFIERYGFTDKARTRARSLTEKSLQYDYDVASSVLSIAYEDTDARFAAAVLAHTLELLEQRFHALSMETVLLKKQHLEERLAVAVADRQAAQERLVTFQRAYGGGFVGIPEQPSSRVQFPTVQLLSDYKQQLLSKEVEMESRRGFLTANDPGLVQLQSEIRILQQVLAELQSGFHYFSAQTIPQEELPRVIANYLNLRRDLQIQEDNYLRLRGQFELTRIEETNPSRTFQVIEAVEVPEIKHKPSRPQVCVVGTVIAFLLSVLLAFCLEYVARVRADPTEAAKLGAIREQLGGRSRAPAGG